VKTKHKPKPVVNFFYADVAPITLKKKRILKQFIVQLFEAEGKAAKTMNYIFCSDEYLLSINQKHLRHNYYTDIITFDLSDTPASIIGEIYISMDRVKDNAIIHKTAIGRELLRVIFHGALHLCGYNDKKKSEITIMRQKEVEYLLLFEQKK
jgi:probable rRNA maturation factor